MQEEPRSEQTWEAQVTFRQLKELFHLHFRTPLHARLRLIHERGDGKDDRCYTVEMLRGNFLQLFGLDLSEQQVRDALQEYCDTDDVVGITRLLDDMMGQGATSAHLPGQEQRAIDTSVTKVSPQQVVEAHASSLSYGPAAREAEMVEKFEEELSRKIAQGIKGTTRMYQILTLLGGRPTCAEFKARLHAHFGLALPDELLPLLLSRYPAQNRSKEEGPLPRLATLAYLHDRILHTDSRTLVQAPAAAAAACMPSQQKKGGEGGSEGKGAEGPGALSVAAETREEGPAEQSVLALQEALRWALLRRVPGKAGMLRDACRLFDMGPTGMLTLPCFERALHEIFGLPASPNDVAGLWARLSGQGVGHSEALPIHSLLRRLMSAVGREGEERDVVQDEAWARLVANSRQFATHRREQANRLPLTGPRKMGAEELISLMALDLTSRRRGLLSQMQYISTVYDPRQGFIDEAGLRQGLHRLGVSLAPHQCAALLSALPTSPEGPRIPLRDFHARLTDPGPAYHDCLPCFSPLRPGNSKGEVVSKPSAPLPPLASALACEPAAGRPPLAAQKDVASQAVSAAGVVLKDCGLRVAEAACAPVITPCPPSAPKPEGAAKGRYFNRQHRGGRQVKDAALQAQEQPAGVASVTRQPSGRGRMFAWRIARYKSARRQEHRREQEAEQPAFRTLCSR